MVKVAAVGLAVALALVACNDGGSGEARTSPPASVSPSPQTPRTPTQSASPTEPATPMPTPTQTPGDTQTVLTERDDGRLVPLTVGDSVAVRLSGTAWETPQLDGTAVTVYPVDYLVDPGYREWIVEAIGSGTAVLRIDTAAAPDADSGVFITFTVEGPS